jgi:hypothetical protein
MFTTRGAAALSLVLALSGVAALPAAGGGVGSVAEAASAAGITLRCYSNPEKTIIRNNTGKAFTIKTVGSTYQPYSYEPITKNKVLGAGMSITYQSGYAAISGATRTLTRNYIYNDNGRDGVRVVTSVGTFTRSCG